jgi:hypothetical protein
MIISPSAISPYKIPTFQSGGAPFVGLLDLYPSAAAAYSVRRLSEVYSGSLMEVRRSSDNALQDIGFDANGDLDTASLLSFVGEEDAFVRTWYDQSGNAYDATQTTTSAQPQIVSSGVISNKNSKPAIDFSGGNWELDANAAASEFAGTDVNFESFSVLSGDGSSNKSFFSLAAASGSTTSLQLRTNGIDFLRVFIRDDANANNNKTTTTQITNQSLVSVLGTPSDYNIYVDGTADAGNPNTVSLGLCSFAKATIGNDARAVSTYWEGTIQELVFYNTDQSSNRTGLETNQNDYYTIY